jgi:hypothetical protein
LAAFHASRGLSWLGAIQAELLQGGKMIKLAMVLVMALLPTLAMAEGECKNEKQKFCKEVVDAGGDVGACLAKHTDELSDACKTRLQARSGAPKGAPAEGAPQ